MSRQNGSWPSYLAAAGAAVGLAGGLLLGGLRVVNSEAPQLLIEWVGNLVFTVIYLTPFALSLLALRARPARRGAVWAGAAILALLGAFSAFSGVSLVLLPAAALLAPAALAALFRRSSGGWLKALLVTATLVGLVGGAWLVLTTGSDDGRCWELVRGQRGESVWRQVPFRQSGTVTVQPEGNEPGVVSVRCTSDVITGAESGLALLLLATAGLPIGWLVLRSPDRHQLGAENT